TDKFNTTPTTAAVTPESAACNARLLRRASMQGAPRKIQRKHGANVTQVVRIEPITPAAIGDEPVWWKYAPRKATNCTTMISGPGVVSAKASPSSIWPAEIQWNPPTARCAL